MNGAVVELPVSHTLARVLHLQPMTAAMVGAGGSAGSSEELDVDASIAAVSAFKGHVASATDVANGIVFLASPDAAACTGINILIDTGLLTGIGGKLPSL